MNAPSAISLKDPLLPTYAEVPLASSSTFRGRIFEKFQDCAKVASNVTSYSEIFHPVARGLAAVVIGLSPWVKFTKLDTKVLEIDQLLDGFRFPSTSLKELLNLEIYSDLARGRLLSVASGVSFLISDLGASIHLLGYFGVVNIAAITTAIGKVAIFGRHLPGIVSKIVVGTLSTQIQAIAHLFLAAHSAWQIAKGDVNKHDVHLRSLAASTMEVAYRSFMIFCTTALTTPPGLVVAGVLGVVANSLGAYASYKKLESQGWKQREATPAVVPDKVKTA